MIQFYLKRDAQPIEIPDATAVAATTFPAAPGNQPAQAIQAVTADGRIIAVFRQAEIAGYDIGKQSQQD